MDVVTVMTPTQLLLIWSLTGLLLLWMILFALLALRPEHKKRAEFFSSAAGSFPQLHVIANQQRAEVTRIEETIADTPTSSVTG